MTHCFEICHYQQNVPQHHYLLDTLVDTIERFFGFGIRCGCRFLSILSYLGSGFSLIWATIDLEYVAAKCHGKGPRVSNDARDFGLTIIWSVSNVPTAPATEDAIVECVAFFFTRKGKAARTRLDRKWKGPREMRVEAKRYQKIRRLHSQIGGIGGWHRK